MLIYGVDPGFTGAVSIYDTELNSLIVHDIPVIKSPKGKTLINLPKLLSILGNGQNRLSLAAVELVSAMPNQGVSSTFRFGQGFGQLEMALVASALPLKYVRPQQWKKYFGLTKDKNQSRELAMERFPNNADLFKRKKDDGRAEAALIALYAKEKLI
jgi:crossover junction endodeoxyribonuclease RuvC|tara:strand:- start:1151 stop:1621 length:471 start_codon:yes stop_codon:yes gene_type:complete